jgi:hypothetical protein
MTKKNVSHVKIVKNVIILLEIVPKMDVQLVFIILSKINVKKYNKYKIVLIYRTQNVPNVFLNII